MLLGGAEYGLARAALLLSCCGPRQGRQHQLFIVPESSVDAQNSCRVWDLGCTVNVKAVLVIRTASRQQPSAYRACVFAFCPEFDRLEWQEQQYKL